MYFGGGGGARGSFRWVESQKKNLHFHSLRRIKPFSCLLKRRTFVPIYNFDIIVGI